MNNYKLVKNTEWKEVEINGEDKEIPIGWDLKKLNNLSEKIGDGLHGTPKYVEKSNFYFINGNNLNNGKNGTAMTVSIDMHKFGRTRGGKNQQVQIDADALDLKTATMKDLANHFLFIQNTYGITSQEMYQFIESSIILWNRNKSLCLYK